jgi:hypothetical protein
MHFVRTDARSVASLRQRVANPRNHLSVSSLRMHQRSTYFEANEHVSQTPVR